MTSVLTLLVVAVSVGLSNFAAAIAIGVPGVDVGTRVRVGIVFGVFEAGMPVVGLLIGQQAAEPLGRAARWIGAGLLIAVGGYALVAATRAGAVRAPRSDRERAATEPAATAPPPVPAGSAGGFWRLILSGFALSLDNLVIGFALGTYHTPILVGALVIGAVSVGLSLIGLELGARIGRWAGRRGEQLAGLMLAGVGIALAVGALK